MGEGEVVGAALALGGRQRGRGLDTVVVFGAAGPVFFLGYVGQVKCGESEEEMEDKGVAQAYLRYIAWPELVHVGVVVAGKGAGCRGDEMEEQLSIVEVDWCRADVHAWSIWRGLGKR